MCLFSHPSVGRGEVLRILISKSDKVLRLSVFSPGFLFVLVGLSPVA